MTKNNEREQSIIRIVIVSAVMSFIAFKTNSVTSSPVLLCAAYLTVAALVHLSILLYPQSYQPRKWLCLSMDVTLTSAEFVIAGEYGAVLIGIYLWLIVGYGLRYGTIFLKGAGILSIIGFLVAYNLNTFYTGHNALMYGLLITLILIPLHTLRLLNQITAEKQKAEYANQAKSQFLSHISHEIRTPLNGVMGGIQLLLDTKLNVDQKHFGHIVNNSASLLMQLVNNVLDLSKIESGKMPVSIVEFDLNELIETSVSLFEPQTQQKNITLNYEISDDVHDKLRGDNLHIKQVIVNLLANAVKFTNQGSVTLAVNTTSQDDSNTTLRFEVVDTGEGIPAEAQSRIFESFTQADDDVKYKFGGTGLGTTISKELIELMNGTIGMHSQLGKGSTFWFELQLEKSAVANSPVITTTQSEDVTYDSENIISLRSRSKQEQDSNQEISILVADDSETNLTIVTKILTNEGYNVQTAKNGEQALDLLETSQFDLMLLDNNMPVMSGLEVIKVHQVINIGKPRIPVVILSADATADTIHKFKEVGVDSYLSKPIDFDKLIRTVDELVKANAINVETDSNKSADILTYKPKAAPVKKVYANTNNLDNLSLLSKDNFFIESLINNFFDDVETSLNQLAHYIANKNYIGIADIGHALVGSAGNIGAEELEKLSLQLNATLPSDSIETINNLSDQIQSTYKITKSELKKYLETKSLPSNQE